MADPRRPTLPEELVARIFDLVADESTLRVARQGSRLLNYLAKAILWRDFTDNDARHLFPAGVLKRSLELDTSRDPNLQDILVRCVRHVDTSGPLLRFATRISPGHFPFPNLRHLNIADGGLPPPSLVPDSLRRIEVCFSRHPTLAQTRALAHILPPHFRDLEISLFHGISLVPSTLQPLQGYLCHLEVPTLDWQILTELSLGQVRKLRVDVLLTASSFPAPSPAPRFRRLTLLVIRSVPLAAAYGVLYLVSQSRLQHFSITLVQDTGNSTPVDLTGILAAAASNLAPHDLLHFELSGELGVGHRHWLHLTSDFNSLKRYFRLRFLSSGPDISWLTLELLGKVLPSMPLLESFMVTQSESLPAFDLSFLARVTQLAPKLITCGLPLDPDSAAPPSSLPQASPLADLHIGRSRIPTDPSQTASRLAAVFPSLRDVTHDYSAVDDPVDEEAELAWDHVHRQLEVHSFLCKASASSLLPFLLPMIPSGLGVPQLEALAYWDAVARLELIRKLSPRDSVIDPLATEFAGMYSDSIPAILHRADNLQSFLAQPMPGVELRYGVDCSWPLTWEQMRQPGTDIEGILADHFPETRLSRFDRAAILIGLSRLS